MAGDTIQNLPEIPDRASFAIGEAAQLCGVQPSVLRYWEREFPQLAPAKSLGKRRSYTRGDIELVRKIRELLYVRGYKVAAARELLAGQPAGRPKDAAADRLVADLEKIRDHLLSPL